MLGGRSWSVLELFFLVLCFYFFFNDTATTEIYTLSLHDALPILGTGTAANALALSLMTPPYGAIYCHREAHIEVDECGAPELFTGGAKLVVLDGDDGKIPSGTLEAALEKVGGVDVHRVPPSEIGRAHV